MYVLLNVDGDGCIWIRRGAGGDGEEHERSRQEKGGVRVRR